LNDGIQLVSFIYFILLVCNKDWQILQKSTKLIRKLHGQNGKASRRCGDFISIFIYFSRKTENIPNVEDCYQGFYWRVGGLEVVSAPG